MKLSDQVAQDIFYAMPRVSSVLLFTPIYVVQGIYAKHYGLALTTIAWVILFVRLFDTITDPIIGYLSDKYRIKSGTRKPSMILGAIVFSISGYLLYSPPDDVNVVYFVFWFTLFYLGFTLFEIPHLAWGGEISHGTHEKNRTYMLRTLAGSTGVILFYSIPLLPLWETSEVTPDTLQFSAIVSGLLMVPLLYFCMKRVPDGSAYRKEKASIDKGAQSSQVLFRQFSKEAKSVIHNTPLLMFLTAFLFAGSGLGMWFGLLFIYVDMYLGLGALFAEISLIALLVSIPGAWVWLKIAKYLGKKSAWLLAMLLAMAGFAYTGLLGPENASYWALTLLITNAYLCFVCVDALPQSMLSDIVDYSSWKCHTYRGSTYFSLYLFTYKAAAAVGGALGLAIAGWYGFDPASTSQTKSGITGLTLAMTWGPTLLVVISIIFIALSPITARRHHIIRRRLEAIEARSKKGNKQIQAPDEGATETHLSVHRSDQPKVTSAFQ